MNKSKAEIQRQMDLLDVEFLSMNRQYEDGFITHQDATQAAAKLDQKRQALQKQLDRAEVYSRLARRRARNAKLYQKEQALQKQLARAEV